MSFVLWQIVQTYNCFFLLLHIGLIIKTESKIVVQLGVRVYVSSYKLISSLNTIFYRLALSLVLPVKSMLLLLTQILNYFQISYWSCPQQSHQLLAFYLLKYLLTMTTNIQTLESTGEHYWAVYSKNIKCGSLSKFNSTTQNQG